MICKEEVLNKINLGISRQTGLTIKEDTNTIVLYIDILQNQVIRTNQLLAYIPSVSTVVNHISWLRVSLVCKRRLPMPCL